MFIVSLYNSANKTTLGTGKKTGLNSKLTLKARANYMIEMRCLKPKWGLGRPEEDHNFITAAGLVV